MSLIHHRIRDGQKVYRLWSPIVGCYLTDELTYDGLMMELRVEAIREALRLVEGPTFAQRMARVHHNGTSDAHDREAKPLDGPWDQEHYNSSDDEE